MKARLCVERSERKVKGMKRLWKNRGGFTLVEIIVTFTLTAIFLSSATLVMSTFLKSHTVARAVAAEQDVAAIVMDTITSSLDGARYEPKAFGSDKFNPEGDTAPTVADEKSLVIADGGSTVWYVDEASGNVVKMYRKTDAEGGYLAMDYFVKPEDAGAGETVKWKKTPWQLGKGVYQNCSLESFEVKKMDGENSCLTISLTVKSRLADGNTFRMQRAVECYNLAKNNIEG